MQRACSIYASEALNFGTHHLWLALDSTPARALITWDDGYTRRLENFERTVVGLGCEGGFLQLRQTPMPAMTPSLPTAICVEGRCPCMSRSCQGTVRVASGVLDLTPRTGVGVFCLRKFWRCDGKISVTTLSTSPSCTALAVDTRKQPCRAAAWVLKEARTRSCPIH